MAPLTTRRAKPTVAYDPEAVRRLRLQSGMEITALAQRAGLSRQGLSYLERGLIEPRVKTLARLATALGAPVEAFFVVTAAPK
jgi:transcriptional regulator with XRE-family HTH domain